MIQKELSGAKACYSNQAGRCIDTNVVRGKKKATRLLGEEDDKDGDDKDASVNNNADKSFQCSSSRNHMSEWIVVEENTNGVDMWAAGTPESGEDGIYPGLKMSTQGATMEKGKKGKKEKMGLSSARKLLHGKKDDDKEVSTSVRTAYTANEYFTSDQMLCRVTSASGKIKLKDVLVFPDNGGATAATGSQVLGTLTIQFAKLSICKSRPAAFYYKGVPATMNQKICADASVPPVSGTAMDRTWSHSGRETSALRRLLGEGASKKLFRRLDEEEPKTEPETRGGGGDRRLLQSTAATSRAATSSAATNVFDSAADAANTQAAKEATQFPSCCQVQKSIVTCTFSFANSADSDKPCSEVASAGVWAAMIA